MNKQVIIVLHEIYGINEFIESTCKKIKQMGFDVYCPNMIGCSPFLYRESQQAYENFINYVGFDIYEKISNLVCELKKKYEKVFILGFSIGATLAWRCCTTSQCDGVVGCYGSRIRNYTNVIPACPTILIFAREDSFDVDTLIFQLQGKPYLEIYELNAKHGFIDSFSQNFNEQQSRYAERLITDFLSKYGE